jgi:preprotein translocase subunit SecA
VLTTALKAIFGSRNDRLLKEYRKQVESINALEQGSRSSDEQLAGEDAGAQAEVAAGASLDSILPEAFAVVREASKRVLGMRHFDVQMIGGIALHQGKIAEMRTGEGKTLVATLPSYLNALVRQGRARGHGERLPRQARRRVDGAHPPLPRHERGRGGAADGPAEKQQSYLADITYGTNNEFGFDYLRDNMATQVAERFQRGLNYAIVDEVDSILIDEARTPLIISGQAEDSTELYRKINR